MAKSKTLRQFSAEWMDRIQRATIGWERRFDSRPQRKRVVADETNVEDFVNPTGGGGGGGCCCQEGDCLHVDGIEDEDLQVAYYWFLSINPCGCEGGSSDGKTKLYAVDDTWQSKHGEDAGELAVECRYPQCTATTYWLRVSGAWVPQSTTNASCGTPLEPDYEADDGTEAETHFEPPLEESYWVREGESLKWYIGGEVVAEYVLDSVRGFSRLCVNKFRLKTETRLKCGSILPPTICLHAGVPGVRVVCEVAEIDVELPSILLASIALTDCPCAAFPSPLQLTAVDQDSLPSGVAAKWESGWFLWGTPGNLDCRPGIMVIGPNQFDAPTQLLPVKLQYVIGSGCPSGSFACWQSCLQLVISNNIIEDGELTGSPYCFPGTSDTLYVHTLGTKAISTIHDLVPLSITGIAAALSFCGGGPDAAFALCGYNSEEFRPDGGYQTNAYPDHYGTITISEPVP